MGNLSDAGMLAVCLAVGIGLFFVVKRGGMA